MSLDLRQRVWDYCTSQALLRPADRVVVGVSGGPDSLCLLDLLHALAARHGLQLHVAHLDHGLRAAAAAEADFVRQQAELRGLPYHSEGVDVGALASARKQSIEAAAREARYAFLSHIAGQVGATLVAVGHTADDQAETVLMHLLRGAGMRGFRGMGAKRLIGQLVNGELVPAEVVTGELVRGQLAVIRPLLEVSRAEVVAYCSEHNLAPRYDSSNLDLRYFRNRVRHELLPILRTYNPKVSEGLGHMATVVAGDYEIWHEAVERLWSETAESEGGGQVTFKRERWLALGAAQQRALLREAAGRLLGGWQDVDFEPLNAAVLFSRRAGPGRECQVAGGLWLRIESDRLSLVGADPAASLATSAGSFPRMRPDGGPAGGLEAGWQLETVRLGPGEWTWADVAQAPRWTAYIDADRIHAPLILRSRVPGDWFQPLGMAGHSMRLAEFMINERVAAGLRARWPLLVCADDIVWVVGLRQDERFKLTAATRVALRVSLRPDDLAGR